MQNKEYLIQKDFLFMWKCSYKCNHHSFIWCSSIIAECVTFVSVYLFNHLGQRNKKYQRYVYLFCFSPQQKVEEIETFTLIKEKGILLDWGNLIWEELKLNEVRKEREKKKKHLLKETWILTFEHVSWVCVSMSGHFFLQLWCFVMRLLTMMESGSTGLNEDKSTNYNKQEITLNENWD